MTSVDILILTFCSNNQTSSTNFINYIIFRDNKPERSIRQYIYFNLYLRGKILPIYLPVEAINFYFYYIFS